MHMGFSQSLLYSILFFAKGALLIYSFYIQNSNLSFGGQGARSISLVTFSNNICYMYSTLQLTKCSFVF